MLTKKASQRYDIDEARRRSRRTLTTIAAEGQQGGECSGVEWFAFSPSAVVVRGLPTVARHQTGKSGGSHAMRRRHGADSCSSKALRLFGHLPEPSLARPYLFPVLAFPVGRQFLRPGSRTGAKDAAQQTGNEEETYQELIHVAI